MDGGKGDMKIDESVAFLYKTMIERDPQKRRVKPVKPHLMQLDFSALADNSSDDSDFKVNSDEDDDDDDEAYDDDDDKAENSDEETDDSNGDDKSENKEENDKDNGSLIREDTSSNRNKGDNAFDWMTDDKENFLKKVSNENMDLSNQIETDHCNLGNDVQNLKKKISSKEITTKNYKMKICSVCLGDYSCSTNEIVECDGCYVCVHEGCFGVSDSLSVASTSSSASMEPWFCDSCKAGEKPHCELCPNLGGVFKETDAGRWVHLVCALYTPGVAFGDVDKLNNVTLFEMPYSKWGAKECSLCEDVRFSRVGVCICCDAGMCRVFFHATCAQREGLLTEASPDEDIADPFYAYCKQHANRTSVRHQHQNWLALQSYSKHSENNRSCRDSDKLRIQRKLCHHQCLYQQAKSKRPPGWVPKEKMPRMLLTNSYALKLLLKKADLLGLNHQDDHNKDNRKKGYVAPAFNTDFVSYYLDRGELIKSIKTKVQDSLKQNGNLRNHEKILNFHYEKLNSEISKFTISNLDIQQNGSKLWDYLTGIYGQRIRIPDNISFRNFVKSPIKKDIALKEFTNLHKCATCNGIRDQHLLVKCDKCDQYHHLGCLDPPLTRMPKKTKQQGWQCSLCMPVLESDEEIINNEEDLNKPRQLREKTLIKEPLKYTTEFQQIASTKSVKDKLKKKKTCQMSANNSLNIDQNSQDHSFSVSSSDSKDISFNKAYPKKDKASNKKIKKSSSTEIASKGFPYGNVKKFNELKNIPKSHFSKLKGVLNKQIESSELEIVKIETRALTKYCDSLKSKLTNKKITTKNNQNTEIHSRPRILSKRNTSFKNIPKNLKDPEFIPSQKEMVSRQKNNFLNSANVNKLPLSTGDLKSLNDQIIGRNHNLQISEMKLLGNKKVEQSNKFDVGENYDSDELSDIVIEITDSDNDENVS